MSKPKVCRYKGFTLIEDISADELPCWCVWEHYELRTGAPVRDFSSESVRYIGIERPTEAEAKAAVRMILKQEEAAP